MDAAMKTTPRSGILAGGNWVVDHVKVIDVYPPEDAHATILDECVGNGGGAYNLLEDLARLGARFPLHAIGLLGDDAAGAAILADCRAHGIDTTQLRTTKAAPTSCTDVMTARGSGRRTFFHLRGANAHLAPEHFDFTTCSARIFSLGYLLLLDRLDELRDGVPAARDVFVRARAAGLVTALDMVSDLSGRFGTVVAPVLPLVDLCFANDFEAEQLTGVALRRPDGSLDEARVAQAARALLDLGVQRWAIVHFPEGAFALGPGGDRVWQGSVCVPPAEIRGTAGAGDAFAAGVLFGVHESWPMAECLRLGVCAGAASLFAPTCSDSVRSKDECLALGRELGFRELVGRGGS